jgi:hypothetical protein
MPSVKARRLPQSERRQLTFGPLQAFVAASAVVGIDAPANAKPASAKDAAVTVNIFIVFSLPAKHWKFYIT